jgi:hypothetical protein
MTKLARAEKSILCMNNMAGDDLWENGHRILKDCPKSSPPHELFKYKNPSSATYNSKGIYLTSIPYTVGKNEKVHLYGFPFLSIDVDPSDIEYPSPISGIIVTQDMRMFDYLIEQDPNFHLIANSYTNRLAWAKAQSLPTILAVHHTEKHRGNIINLSRLAGMDIFCPVLWHAGEPDSGFFSKAIKAVLASC